MPANTPHAAERAFDPSKATEAALAIERLHALVALAHDAVQTIYNHTPESDQRFVPIDLALSDVECAVRKLRNGTYLPNGRVAELSRKVNS